MEPNSQKIQGQWNQIRGEVRKRWGQLTDDDLTMQGGNIDSIVGKIQQKTGEGREVIEKYLTDLTEKGSSMIADAAEYGKKLQSGANEQFNNAYQTAETALRDRPLQSAGLVFGIGVAFGMLLSGALRRD